MGIMITCYGYNNPVNIAHKTVGAHYTWEHIMYSKIWYFKIIWGEVG